MTIEKLLEDIELPKWARWAAQDEDGSVCVFSARPRRKRDCMGGFWSNRGSKMPRRVMRTKVTGDWRDTLTRLEARE